QSLYTGVLGPGGIDLDSECRRARYLVGTTAAHGARPLAHGHDVRLGLRYRAQRDPQCTALRPRLLRRPELRPSGLNLHPSDIAARNLGAARPDRADARGGA